MTHDLSDKGVANEVTRAAWETNATFWNERMGEGNRFVNELIWPATLRLLDPQPEQRILDVACGNGLYARRLAALGAEVVAFDFSQELINLAATNPTHSDRITYHVIDATDEKQLAELGKEQFDAAICQMALFDMAEIEPLFRTLPNLLKPAAPFVFTIVHPCFNNNHFKFVGEREDQDGELVTTYSLSISGYMSSTSDPGLAMADQPVPHIYFHRPLSELLRVAFHNGFVLNGLEECAFPADASQGSSGELAWGGNFSEFPPVLAARVVQSQ